MSIAGHPDPATILSHSDRHSSCLPRPFWHSSLRDLVQTHIRPIESVPFLGNVSILTVAFRALHDQGPCHFPPPHPAAASPDSLVSLEYSKQGPASLGERGEGKVCISSPFCPGCRPLWLPCGLFAHLLPVSVKCHCIREACLVVLYKIAALPGSVPSPASLPTPQHPSMPGL